MKLTKVDDKGILLTPHTAAEESFIYCLIEMIEAREAKFMAEHASNLQSLARDCRPLTIKSGS